MTLIEGLIEIQSVERDLTKRKVYGGGRFKGLLFMIY